MRSWAADQATPFQVLIDFAASTTASKPPIDLCAHRAVSFNKCGTKSDCSLDTWMASVDGLAHREATASAPSLASFTKTTDRARSFTDVEISNSSAKPSGWRPCADPACRFCIAFAQTMVPTKAGRTKIHLILETEASDNCVACNV